MHRQTTAMADALVGPDLDLAADVGLHLAAQITFDLVVGFDPVTQLDDRVVVEVVHADVGAHPGLTQRLLSTGTADAVDVGQSDLEPLLARQVDTNKASHLLSRSSALALLVTGVVAQHHDATVPADHLALVADLLDARLDLHGVCSVLTCTGRRCGRGTGRTARAPRRRGPPAGCGCSAGASCR